MQSTSKPQNPSLPIGVRADFLLMIAGCHIRLDLPNEAVRAALQVALGLMTATERPSHSDLILTWDGTRCVVQPGSRHIIAQSPSRIPALTLVLLLERLRALLPDLMPIHGNALYDREQNRPLMLVGDSGRGKSTLSSQLLTLDRFTLLAEDTLLIRLGDRLIHPFPRAASLRVQPGQAPQLSRWQGLGNRCADKVLVSPDRTHPSAESLAEAAIFVLAANPPAINPLEGPGAANREQFWISHANHSLEGQLATEFPGARIEHAPAESDSFPCVIFEQQIADEDRSDFLALLAEQGVMVLSSRLGPTRPTLSETKRPPQPILRMRNPLSGLKSLLNHEVHFSAPDIIERDPSRTLMEMGRVFHHAQHFELIPGGTPAETATCILNSLDGSS